MVDDDREAVFNVGGFQIEKKASFTSLAAFILSVWGVLQSTYYYIGGSDLTLVKPERFVAFRDACHTRSGETLNFVLPITIVNKKQKDYSSVLQDIELNFILDREYTFDSEAYVYIGSPKDGKYGFAGCDKGEDYNFLIEELKTAPTEIIRGGESLAAHILFVPKIPHCPDGAAKCYSKNYIPTGHGSRILSEKIGENLSIDVKIEYDDGDYKIETCEFPVTEAVLASLQQVRHFDVFCAE